MRAARCAPLGPLARLLPLPVGAADAPMPASGAPRSVPRPAGSCWSGRHRLTPHWRKPTASRRLRAGRSITGADRRGPDQPRCRAGCDGRLRWPATGARLAPAAGRRGAADPAASPARRHRVRDAKRSRRSRPDSIRQPRWLAETAIEPAARDLSGRSRSRARARIRCRAAHGEPARPAATGPDAEASAAAPAPSEPPSAVKVSAEARPGELELRFRWGRAVPAAVFERGRPLWVVFPDADARGRGLALA